MSYEINYDDTRFQEVEADKDKAISDLEQTYSGMINESDSFYQAQINASKEWEKTQKENQQAQTDFAIEQIEQQKDQTKKDYLKEQSGSYVDWQKEKNAYGVGAEQRADSGLKNTGYSESSQVSLYNTYQNRVMTARETYNRAVLNYDNAIKDARLQNNSALAEIAYNALQQQLELSLQGFQYKNTLLLEKANKKTEMEQMYHERWQDVLAQINTENSMAEEIRQFNEKMAEDTRQFNEQMAMEREQFEWQKEQAKKSSSRSYSGGGGSSSKSSSSGNGSASINKSSGSGSSGDVSVNMQSVLNLGEGPISEAALAKKVNSGEVTTKQIGNQIYVAKSKNTTNGTASKYLNLTGFGK